MPAQTAGGLYDQAVTDTVLSKGQNCALPDEAQRLQLVVAWEEPDGAVAVDAGALLLTDARRVRSDDDFVFFNQPTSPEGALRHVARPSSDAGAEERIAVDLAAVPDEVTTVAVTASLLEGTFGDLHDLRLLVLDDVGDSLVRFEITGASSETAFVFGEVYRRGETWKVRAVGQGWDSGLAGLATDFGVTVDDTPEVDSSQIEPGGNSTPQTHPMEQHEIVMPRVPENDAAASPGEAAAREEASDGGSLLETDLVEVVEPEQPTSSGQLIVLSTIAPPSSLGTVPATPSSSAVAKRRTAGVRTSKAAAAPAAAPKLKLGADTWEPARLFSVSGVGSAEEQEKRATSVLLATMMAVPAFARALTGRFGAPAGIVETYLEVPFPLAESTVRPDGVIRVARGARIWTGLLEVKTGSGQLRREQVENYLDVARNQGYDTVITLSNEIAPHAGEHPVVVDKRKLRKTTLLHLSWAEVLHEAKMTLAHRGAGDPLQAWLIAELIRYLEHPRSGAATFDDMGAAWVPVRESIAAGTLRSGDRKVPAVADAWTRLVRHLCLRLSSELGVTVTHSLPRKLAADPAARIAAIVARLAGEGVLEAELKVPLAAGPVTVTADLRTSQVRVSVQLHAPQEGTGQRRVSWLLRQLRDAPDDLLVEAMFATRTESACEKLGDIRDNPAVLLPDRTIEVASFRLAASPAMGTKRSGVRGAFVHSVVTGVEAFYSTVVQPLKPWVPAAPKLPENVTTDALAEQAAGPAERDAPAEGGTG